MDKIKLIKRLQELRKKAWEPWSEIHGLVAKQDGDHCRILGLGIKDSTIKLCDAIGELIKSYEKEIKETTNE